MLLFIPVTRADYHLATPLLRLFDALGGIGNHTVVVAVAKEGVPAVDADHILHTASKLGDKVYPMQLADVIEYGWPRNANFIFQEAAMTMAVNKAYGEKCWYFFELDNCPTKPGWLDELQAEYDYRARPCMGVINVTTRSRSGGDNYEDGKHLVGAGIYPPNLFSIASVTKHLHILGDPFDVALQHQVVPLTWATGMIQHNWSTKEYKLDGDKATCENAKDRPASKVYAQPVNLGDRGPLVVHGCKDTSLIQIVSKRYAPQPKNKKT
jgi:hypothetical protein